MLRSITFKEDYRTFKTGDILTFKKITLLVGDNGCGKSTILQVIQRSNKVSVDADISQLIFLDYEKHNPRIKNRIDSAMDIMVQRASHGEVVRKITRDIPKIKEDFVALMDEPDIALSLRGAKELIDLIKNFPENGQFIASIHHPWIIEAFPEVLDLEEKKWVKSTEYLNKYSIW